MITIPMKKRIPSVLTIILCSWIIACDDSGTSAKEETETPSIADSSSATISQSNNESDDKDSTGNSSSSNKQVASSSSNNVSSSSAITSSSQKEHNPSSSPESSESSISSSTSAVNSSNSETFSNGACKTNEPSASANPMSEYGYFGIITEITRSPSSTQRLFINVYGNDYDGVGIYGPEDWRSYSLMIAKYNKNTMEWENGTLIPAINKESALAPGYFYSTVYTHGDLAAFDFDISGTWLSKDYNPGDQVSVVLHFYNPDVKSETSGTGYEYYSVQDYSAPSRKTPSIYTTNCGIVNCACEPEKELVDIAKNEEPSWNVNSCVTSSTVREYSWSNATGNGANGKQHTTELGRDSTNVTIKLIDGTERTYACPSIARMDSRQFDINLSENQQKFTLEANKKTRLRIGVPKMDVEFLLCFADDNTSKTEYLNYYQEGYIISLEYDKSYECTFHYAAY